MKDEQTALQDNFSSFINKFVQNGQSQYPFKMAVATTEAYRDFQNKTFFQGDNCFPGSNSCIPYDLSSEAAQNNLQMFINDFKSAVGVGTSGSGNEKSLLSAHKVTEKYPSWFSPDRTLSVYIPVSDEQEQSHLGWDDSEQPLNSAPLLDETGQQYTIEKWVQIFQARKGDNPGLVKFFPIVRITPIPGEYGDGDVGNRYQKLAQLTGGQRYNIDNPFDGILDDLGNSIVNLLKSFLLKGDRNINPDTLKVWVNGVVVTNWTYQNKAIRFNEPPADGSTIKVAYEYTEN